MSADILAQCGKLPLLELQTSTPAPSFVAGPIDIAVTVISHPGDYPIAPAIAYAERRPITRAVTEALSDRLGCTLSSFPNPKASIHVQAQATLTYLVNTHKTMEDAMDQPLAGEVAFTSSDASVPMPGLIQVMVPPGSPSEAAPLSNDDWWNGLVFRLSAAITRRTPEVEPQSGVLLPNEDPAGTAPAH